MNDLCRFKFLLRPEEQADYPRGDEWFTFDLAAIDRDLTTEAVIALENELGFSLDVLQDLLRMGATRGKLWAFWIARRLAGVEEKRDFFTPRVRAAGVIYLDEEKADGQAGDADPPADTPRAGTDSAEEPRSS